MNTAIYSAIEHYLWRKIVISSNTKNLLLSRVSKLLGVLRDNPDKGKYVKELRLCFDTSQSEDTTVFLDGSNSRLLLRSLSKIELVDLNNVRLRPPINLQPTFKHLITNVIDNVLICNHHRMESVTVYFNPYESGHQESVHTYGGNQVFSDTYEILKSVDAKRITWHAVEPASQRSFYFDEDRKVLICENKRVCIHPVLEPRCALNLPMPVFEVYSSFPRTPSIITMARKMGTILVDYSVFCKMLEELLEEVLDSHSEIQCILVQTPSRLFKFHEGSLLNWLDDREIPYHFDGNKFTVRENKVLKLIKVAGMV